jgi:hypothetical protein
MEELSPKEIVLSLAFLFVAIALAVFINPFVKDAMLDDIRSYQNALQIKEDANQFQYASSTKVGKVFAYGKMNAVYPVTLPEILGQWGMVEKVEEEYTRYSRQVCNGHDSDGDCTSYRTEYYYTWDRNGAQTFISSDFMFLSVNFPSPLLEIGTSGRLELNQDTVAPEYFKFVDDNCIYEEDDWWASVGDLRWYYKVLPIQFNASMFVNFNSQDMRGKVYYEQSQEQVLEVKESEIRKFDFIYYLIWIFTFVGGWLYWSYNHGEIE